MGKRLCLFLAVLFVSVGIAFAQTQVNGTVVSAEDGEPVVGASVIVKIQPQRAHRWQNHGELHWHATPNRCGKTQHEDYNERRIKIFRRGDGGRFR